MDGQEYLNQISASTKAPKPGGKNLSFLKSKYFIFGVASLGALIVIMIIGAILSGNKVSEKDYGIRLHLHLGYTAELVEKFQPSLKSSKLRAYSASLGSVLNDADKPLGDYLKEKYNFKSEKDADKKIQGDITTAKESLDNELFEAKINGLLDRTFAHKMAYETTMLMTEENKMISITKNSALKEALEKSRDSLENLYNNFNDFSETK